MCYLLWLCYLLWYYYGCYTYYGIRRVPELVRHTSYGCSTYYGAGLGFASTLGLLTHPTPSLPTQVDSPLPLTPALTPYTQVDFRVQGRDKSRAFWQRRLYLNTPLASHSPTLSPTPILAAQAAAAAPDIPLS